MKIFLLLFLIWNLSLTLFSNDNSVKLSPEFIAFNEALVDFESQEKLFFILSSLEQISSTEKDLSGEAGVEKIIRDFPILSLSADEGEIEYFYNFTQYKEKLKELTQIRDSISKDRMITLDEREYLRAFYQLVSLNLWIKFVAQNPQQRGFGEGILNTIILSVNNNINLPRDYSSNYYTYYGETLLRLLNLALSNSIIRYIPYGEAQLKTESEIYLLKALHRNKDNLRAQLLYYTASFKENNYFYSYSQTSNLERILKDEKTTKNEQFIINLILANIFYVKNNLTKSWSYLVRANQLFPESRAIELVQANFKKRENSLFPF